VADEEIKGHNSNILTKLQLSLSIQSMFRNNCSNYEENDNDSDCVSSNMEAGYDEIEREEMFTAKIGAREDA
jgi:SPT2 chromatin protein